MEESEKKYFERLIKYRTPKIKTHYSESQQDIYFFSSQIRNIAKDTLNGNLSSENSKKEISKLLKTIEELNQSLVLTN